MNSFKVKALSAVVCVLSRLPFATIHKYRYQAIQKLVSTACILLSSSLTVNAVEVTYTNVSPILISRCVMCHSGPAAPLGLQLDTLEALLKGSQNGAVVLKGNSSASELIRRLKGLSEPRMPMTGPPFLSDEEITLFEQWIDGGLKPGVASENDNPNTSASETTDSKPDTTISESTEEYSKRFPKTTESTENPSTTASTTAGSTTAAYDTDGITVYADIAVILATRCAKCHTENGLMGPAPEGYLLTSYASTVSANDRVRVAPGMPLASELLRRIRGHARPRMPFDGPPYLTNAEILAIERWIKDGARDSSGNAAPVPIGNRVRLHGTLDRRWRLDGLDLVVTRSTRLDKNPGPGDYVRVRGRIRNDGKVVVDRITRR